MQTIFREILILSMLTSIAVFMFAVSTPAAEQLDVTRHDALYLDRFISLTIEWQSVNPVQKILISAARDSRTVMIDEFDNRRNARGYQGTITVQLQADPQFAQAGIPYQIQLEDDLRQKSAVFSGNVSVTGSQAQHPPQRDDSWGQPNIKASQTNIVNKLQDVNNRFDLAPSMDVIKVNVLSPDNATFSSKANDDKGLLEIRFRVYSGLGTLVGFQSISNLGKIWQGSSQSFDLGGGTFQVVGQATDTSGNTSKEQSVSFTLNGTPRDLPWIEEPARLTPTQSTATPLPYDPQMPQQTTTPYPDQMSPYQTQPNQSSPYQASPYPTSPYQTPPTTYQPTAPNQPPPLPPPLLPPPLPNDSGFGAYGQQPAR